MHAYKPFILNFHCHVILICLRYLKWNQMNIFFLNKYRGFIVYNKSDLKKNKKYFLN